MADGRGTEIAERRPDGEPDATVSSEYFGPSLIGASSSLRRDVIVRSLQARLGEHIDAAVIAAEVEREIAAYSSVRVTQFVSILVERGVCERLSRHGFATNEQGSGRR